MLNFAFLWVIASVFMGILDTVRMLPEVTGQITLARGGNVMLILLLIGLVLSFIEVWKGASKNSQKTKILNIVDDEAPSKRGDGKGCFNISLMMRTWKVSFRYERLYSFVRG